MENKIRCYFFEPDMQGHIEKPPIIRTLKVENNTVTTVIDESLCKFFVAPGSKYSAYVISRPEPIAFNAHNVPLNAKQLHAMLDSSILTQLACATKKMYQPKSPLLRWVMRRVAFWRDADNEAFWADQGKWTDTAKHFKGWVGDQIADYLEQNGTTEGDFIVISKQMLENIRQGGVKNGNNGI